VRATWWGAVGLALAAACMPGPKPPEPLKPVRFLLINDVYVADTLNDGSGDSHGSPRSGAGWPIRGRSCSSLRATS